MCIITFTIMPNCFPRDMIYIHSGSVLQDSTAFWTYSILRLFTFCPSDNCVVGSHLVFNLHFPGYKKGWTYFHGSIDHLELLSCELLVQTSFHFFQNCLVFFKNVFYGFFIWPNLLLVIFITNKFPTLWIIFSLKYLSINVSTLFLCRQN